VQVFFGLGFFFSKSILDFFSVAPFWDVLSPRSTACPGAALM